MRLPRSTFAPVDPLDRARRPGATGPGDSAWIVSPTHFPPREGAEGGPVADLAFALKRERRRRAKKTGRQLRSPGLRGVGARVARPFLIRTFFGAVWTFFATPEPEAVPFPSALALRHIHEACLK